jgi:hypothetical protein
MTIQELALAGKWQNSKMRAARGSGPERKSRKAKSNLHAFSEIHSEPPLLTTSGAAFAGFGKTEALC